jgi:hypothetical protein
MWACAFGQWVLSVSRHEAEAEALWGMQVDVIVRWQERSRCCQSS